MIAILLLQATGNLLIEGKNVNYWRKLQQETASTWSDYEECKIEKLSIVWELKESVTSDEHTYINAICKDKFWGGSWLEVYNSMVKSGPYKRVDLPF
ncbi:hypothetical protein KJ596_03680 [Patescibacteria group bacterium]|nr:hypothetical protein [Patescibacteria group bacterium]MBU1868288.1 hypothetical protein [Patescibacteria group bacterium]